MVELVDVTKTYGDPGDPASVSVLKGITLKIEQGKAIVIVGPSGCGKSTLLNIVGGLDHATSGQVLLDGRDLAKVDDDELARIRNRQIGFVFQMHHLLPQCTVLENVLVPTLATKGQADGAALRKEAESLLDRGRPGGPHSHRPANSPATEAAGCGCSSADQQAQSAAGRRAEGSLDEESPKHRGASGRLNREDGVTLVVVTHSRNWPAASGM
jgi:ABC-type lipoprotein export system ATPase subunit